MKKEISNPGFGEKQMDKEKFVKRWLSWAVDYMHLVNNHDDYLKFKEQVRKFCWDMYKELRSMRGKRKKIDIFAVEMTVMQLGLLANGMQEKEKESE